MDEEELLFVFQALTQFYPVLSGLAFDEEDFEEIVFSDQLPESIRRASMAWLDGCLRRRYDHNVSFYRYFEDVLAAGDLPAGQILTVRYDDMMSDLERVVAEVADFADLDLSQEARRGVAEQTGLQRTYQRGHANEELAQYGLTRAGVVRDLGFVFDRYGFDRLEAD